MIHTNLPKKCRGFSQNTVDCFMESKLDSINWRVLLVHKENYAISRHVLVDRYILLLQQLSNHAFYNKHFSWTNLIDPKQFVPLDPFLTKDNFSPLHLYPLFLTICD